MKETISKAKRQPSEEEKIIASEAIDKKLFSKILQAVHATQYQKNEQPDQTVDKRTKQPFPQRGYMDG